MRRLPGKEQEEAPNGTACLSGTLPTAPTKPRRAPGFQIFRLELLALDFYYLVSIGIQFVQARFTSVF